MRMYRLATLGLNKYIKVQYSDKFVYFPGYMWMYIIVSAILLMTLAPMQGLFGAILPPFILLGNVYCAYCTYMIYFHHVLNPNLQQYDDEKRYKTSYFLKDDQYVLTGHGRSLHELIIRFYSKLKIYRSIFDFILIKYYTYTMDKLYSDSITLIETKGNEIEVQKISIVNAARSIFFTVLVILVLLILLHYINDILALCNITTKIDLPLTWIAGLLFFGHQL